MTLFPTFAAWFRRSVRPAGPSPRGLFPSLVGSLLPTSSGQRRALAGLLAFALDEGIDPVPLLRAWAEDESGRQRSRVSRLAGLLGRGIPLGEAIARVPGALRPQDMTALVVAGSLRGDAGEALAVFDAPASSSEPVDRTIRWTLGYAATLAIVMLPVASVLAFRVAPQYARILDEFGMEHSPWFTISRRVLSAVGPLSLAVASLLLLAWLASRLVPTWWRGVKRSSGLGGIGSLAEARAADWLGTLDVAARAGADRARAAEALALGTPDRGLRAALGRRGSGAILAAAESAALDSRPTGAAPWVARALARRRRERILDRKWLASQLLVPALVLLMGAFVFVQAMGLMEPLFHLIGGLT